MKVHEGVVEEGLQQSQQLRSADCKGQSVQALPHVPDDGQGLRIEIFSNDLEMPVRNQHVHIDRVATLKHPNFGSKSAAKPHWTEEEQFLSKVLVALAVQVLVTLAVIYAFRRPPMQPGEEARIWCSVLWSMYSLPVIQHFNESMGQKPMSWIGVLLLTCISDVLVAGAVAGSNSELLLLAMLVTLICGLALATLACKWGWHNRERPQYCYLAVIAMFFLLALGILVSLVVAAFVAMIFRSSIFLKLAIGLLLMFNSCLVFHATLLVFGPPDYCGQSWNPEGFVDAAMLLHAAGVIWFLPWCLLLITAIHKPKWLG